MSTTLDKAQLDSLSETLLDKYDIHVTVHNCGLKSCEVRTSLWDRYMESV